MKCISGAAATCCPSFTSVLKSARYLCLAILPVLALFGVAERADAATLYAASAAGATGRLYILNPATGAVVQDIGPLNDAAGKNYPITGLAFHPTTGVLYGSTGNANTTAQGTFVTINPATALVSVIGPFNAGPTNSGGDPATMADLAFTPSGTLYGVGSIGGPQLYTINTATGQASVVGSTGLTSTSGGGVGVSPSGQVFGTPTSSRFGTYDTTTGAYTNITNPTKPVGGAYAALAFSGSTLFGLDLGPDSAGKPTMLVTFDTTTGAVTNVGASIASLDAIAFLPVPEPTTIALFAVGLGMLVAARRR